MRILDLFCGAGGASMGYHRAWPDAEIVGVDSFEQPHYPFDFILGDAIHPTVAELATEFDLIHASPPCQAHSTLRHSPGARQYRDYIAATRTLLEATDATWIIENVPGAPLEDPITLCGSMFGLRYDGYELRRHRLFETNLLPGLPQLECDHRDPVLGVYGDLSRNRRPSTRGVKAGIEDAQRLMGIVWMTPKELVQAIPPAYTRWIAEQIGQL